MAMLAVRLETLAEFGAVSEAVAVEMAEGALRHSAATLAVAITGIAGPGGSEHKPEGLVCFALAQSLLGLIAARLLIGAGLAACLMAPLTCFASGEDSRNSLNSRMPLG